MTNNIKRILLPTDFSDLGDFAYRLAAHIVKNTDATIDVISIIPGPSGAFYSSDGALVNDDGDDYSEWAKRLKDTKELMHAWTKDKAHIKNTHCAIGNVDRDIIRYATDHEMDIITMGTDGLYTKSLWSEPSHAEFISNHSPVPVLTLKCDRSDIDLKEIILVSDFLVAKPIDLSIIKSLQSVFNSKLLLLKIKKSNAIRSTFEINNDIEAFAKANGLSNYERCIYENESVEAGIGKFAAERDVDLITLGTHQKNGFSKLFRLSISDDVVNHLFHPVLTFPLS